MMAPPSTRPLFIRGDVAVRLRDLAAEHGRWEACGLLFGDETESGSVVHELVQLPNVAMSPHRFAIDRAAIEQARRARASTPIVVFHTHEGDAELSGTDRASLQRAKLPWLICGQGEMRAYNPDLQPRVIIIEEEKP